MNHADAGGQVTLAPGTYRFRLRWNIDDDAPNNDPTDDVDTTPPVMASLKNILAELQTNTNARLAISANNNNKGRVNLYATNIVILDMIDSVNSHDTNTTAPVSIGRTGADTRINVLSDVNKPAGAPATIRLTATPVLSSSQRGVAQVQFYKNVGAGDVNLGAPITTGAAASYSIDIPVPEAHNTNINYGARMVNLLDQGGTPIN